MRRFANACASRIEFESLHTVSKIFLADRRY